MNLGSVLKAYDGGIPFDDWYSKFKLVAKYSGWKDSATQLAMFVLG